MPKQKIKGHTLCILHGSHNPTTQPLAGSFHPYKLLIDPRKLLSFSKNNRKPQAGCESAAKAVLSPQK